MAWKFKYLLKFYCKLIFLTGKLEFFKNSNFFKSSPKMKKRCIFWRQNSNQTILVILSQCVLRYSVLKSRDHHDYHLCHLQVLYRDEQAFLVNFTRTKTPRITTSLDNKPPQKSSSNLERKIRKPIASSFRRWRIFFFREKTKENSIEFLIPRIIASSHWLTYVY